MANQYLAGSGYMSLAAGDIPALPIVSSLNGSSGSLSVSAGANIGIGQANSTITISASVQTSSLSMTALGNTTLSSSGTASNLLNFSGAGAVSVGVSNNTVYISGGTAAAGTVSITALGNTTNSSSGTFSNLLNFSGAGIASVGAGAGSVTISVPNQTVNLPARISYTQNFDFAAAGPVSVGIIATTGSTAATATNNPFGSSMSLQRIFIPAVMSLSEVDLAFGISFPATNSGAGTLSQTFQLFSFGNSTSLASVLTASRSVTWASGTSTSGTSSSLQQGWQSYQVQPFTFAASSLSAGEYAVAHLAQWAAVNTSWTISVFGANAASLFTASAVTNVAPATSALTAFSAAPTAANALSSGGLAAVSAFTASSSSSLTAWSAAPTAMNALSSSALVSFSNSWSVLSATAAAEAITMGATASGVSIAGFSKAASATFTSIAGSYHSASGSGAVLSNAGTSAFAGFLGSGGLSAGSFVGTSGSVGAVSNAGTAAMTVLSGDATVTGSSTFGSSGLFNFGYNGTFAMTTSTNVATYLSGQFLQGIFLTGGSAASLALSSTAATVTGSLALVQPWFALVGS
jgi:trimeric autotransporter adhesin